MSAVDVASLSVKVVSPSVVCDILVNVDDEMSGSVDPDVVL